ncbi:MAG: hypothetical protein JXN59_00955, partial [Anaerolineae bacterium]|nr:hypothetical protein [Anaerolineae bacterium]
ARADGLGYEWTTNFSYSLARALTLIAPNLYGTPADGSYLTEGAYFEDAAYAGLLPIIAAFFAMMAWLRRRQAASRSAALESAPFWAGMALLAFLIALGKNGFLFPLLYEYVPTFHSFQGPVRWLILAVFALALLAGMGVSYAWGRGKWTLFWSRLALAAGLGMALIASVIAPLVMDTGGAVVQVMQRALLTVGVLVAAAAVLTLVQPEGHIKSRTVFWQIAVLVVVGLDLFVAFRGLNPTVPAAFFAPQESADADAGAWLYRPEAAVDALMFEEFFPFADYRIAVARWPELRQALLPNMNILDRVPMYNNFDPIDTQAHTDAVSALEADLAGNGARLIILEPDAAPKQEPFGQEALRLGAGITALSALVTAALWAVGRRQAHALPRPQYGGR